MLAPSASTGDPATAILQPGPNKFTVTPACVIEKPPNEVIVSDRLLRFRVTASMDNPTVNAEVTFALSSGSSSAESIPDSLSPLVTGSTRLMPDGSAILSPNNILRLTVDTEQVTGLAGTGTWPIFKGRIDRISIGANGDEITVQCRDMGGFYLNRMIEEATKYGSAGGDAAEGVMQDILFDNGFGTLDLEVPVSPGFSIYEYAQQEMPVLAALRQIAQQFGWDVRWFPSIPNVFGQALRLYDPSRGRTGADITVVPGRYQSIEELAWGDEDVRNSWDVYWQDASGIVQTVVHVEDADSIAAYGRRYARIYLQRAENIRSEGSALAFADAALADSKDPFASHVIKAPFLPMVELNDLHAYPSNSVHYDIEQLFAVVAYTHEYANGHIDTTVGARGRPLAAYRDYRRSIPPKVIVSLDPPDDAIYAPEGTIHLQTETLAFP